MGGNWEKNKNRMVLRQIQKLMRDEQRLMRQKPNVLITEKTDPVRQKLKEKIPKKMEVLYYKAFQKGFQAVFDRGTPFIEKVCNVEKERNTFKAGDAALHIEKSRRAFARLDADAWGKVLLNDGISAVEGAALGLLGVGLPDIPILIAVVLKTVYQAALSYGFSYDSRGERIFILYVICAAATMEEERARYSANADSVGIRIDSGMDAEEYLEAVQTQASKCLADAMAGVKIIQGVPLVGAVAGFTNCRLVHAVGRMARIKYKKRYLRRLSVETNSPIWD